MAKSLSRKLQKLDWNVAKKIIAWKRIESQHSLHFYLKNAKIEAK